MCEKSQVSQPGENQEQPITKQHETNIEKNLDPNSAPSKPAHSEVNPTPIAPTNSNQENQTTKHGWKEFQWWKERGELVAIFAAIGIGIINFNQWQEMRADRFLDERAWVLPTSGDAIQKVSDDKKSTFFQFPIKNTGKTPAINVVTCSAFTIDKDTIPISDPYPQVAEHQGLCAPEQIEHVGSPTIPSEIMIDVGNGRPFYIYGTIWYDDIWEGITGANFAIGWKGVKLTAISSNFTLPKITIPAMMQGQAKPNKNLYPHWSISCQPTRAQARNRLKNQIR